LLIFVGVLIVKLSFCLGSEEMVDGVGFDVAVGEVRVWGNLGGWFRDNGVPMSVKQ